jgi:predicted esterase
LWQLHLRQECARASFSLPILVKPQIALTAAIVLSSVSRLVAGEPDVPLSPGFRSADRQFTNSAPYSSEIEIRRHFGYAVPFPAYALSQEKFRTLVPSDTSTNRTWGLLIWISPEDGARVPEAILSEAQSHQLLCVSAYKSGNNRHPLDRFRLALDAVFNVCQEHRIDRTRIYVSGFSGGSRIASMLGVGYGDLFSGTLSICGVNYYRMTRGAEGEEYPGTYLPAPGALARARKAGRFVLITGETDPNRPSTHVLAEKGFKQDGFRNVLVQEVPGMGHAVPGPSDIRKALDFLENRPDKNK